MTGRWRIELSVCGGAQITLICTFAGLPGLDRAVAQIGGYIAPAGLLATQPPRAAQSGAYSLERT
jgi:hypothetical protein